MRESLYAWVITVDHFKPEQDGGKSLVGLSGPRSATLTTDQIKSHPQGKKFRIKDDDGELYYEGVFVDLTSDQRLDGFQPLDDYGTPGLGATVIEYWEAGKGGGWKPL